MQIKLREISVKELSDLYEDNEEKGVVGYSGKLDIRPPYQREFIYNEKQRNAVIDTLTKNFPLNIMYWCVRENGTFEVIDGQQRTISICQYVNGDFSFKKKYFHNLQDDEQDQILNYRLSVYLCTGTDSERLEWFRTINIAGEELTQQEINNAVYAGPWVSDAKRYFSKNGCAAYGIGSDYLKGSLIRQDYFETAIKWISDNNIEEYMARHQKDEDANDLWLYFQSVIAWVSSTFKNKRSFMKGVDWGSLYNLFKDEKFNTDEIEDETARLILDDDVTKNSGIYPYILTRNEKYLSIRTFSDSQKQKAYEKQKGICSICADHFEFKEMQGDHKIAWNKGGRTIDDNCQMLCIECNLVKSAQ